MKWIVIISVILFYKIVIKPELIRKREDSNQDDE